MRKSISILTTLLFLYPSLTRAEKQEYKVTYLSFPIGIISLDTNHNYKEARGQTNRFFKYSYGVNLDIKCETEIKNNRVIYREDGKEKDIKGKETMFTIYRELEKELSKEKIDPESELF